MLDDRVTEHDVELTIRKREPLVRGDGREPDAWIQLREVRRIFNPRRDDPIPVRIPLLEIVRFGTRRLARDAEIENAIVGRRPHQAQKALEHPAANAQRHRRRERETATDVVKW
jgi:hypothetical protein